MNKNLIKWRSLESLGSLVNVKYERVNINSVPGVNINYKFEIDLENKMTMVPMDSAHQGLYACEVWKCYNNSMPLMDLNTNLHLTLKLEMLKVKVKDKGHIDSAHQGVSACEDWKNYHR